MAEGASDDIIGSRSRGRGVDVRHRRKVERYQRTERVQGGGVVPDKVGDGVGVGADGIPGQSPCGGGELAGGGPNPERGR